MVRAMRVRFLLEGKIVPKARPRVTARGTHMPPKYVAYRERVRARACLEARDVQWPMHATYRVQVFYSHGLVKSGERKGADMLSAGDVDNVCGTVLDALNGVLWVDDAQVDELGAWRIRGDKRQWIEVTVEAIKWE